MEIAARSLPRSDSAAIASASNLECRVCELETENARLRLLVGELLVANQRLREAAAAVRGNDQKHKIIAG